MAHIPEVIQTSGIFGCFYPVGLRVLNHKIRASLPNAF